MDARCLRCILDSERSDCSFVPSTGARWHCSLRTLSTFLVEPAKPLQCGGSGIPHFRKSGTCVCRYAGPFGSVAPSATWAQLVSTALPPMDPQKNCAHTHTFQNCGNVDFQIAWRFSAWALICPVAGKGCVGSAAFALAPSFVILAWYVSARLSLSAHA